MALRLRTRAVPVSLFPDGQWRPDLSLNILMLGRWLPPPRRPVRATRVYQFARHLARRHRLTLAFIADSADATGSISALRNEFGDLEFATVPRAWKSLGSALRVAAGESCALSYSSSEALRTRLAERLRRTRYDVVFVSASSMIPYALDIDPAIPIAADFGEVDSEWWSRRAARGALGAARFFRTEALRLRVAETAAARRAARCIVETPAAARIVQALGSGSSPVIIPNGVDVDALKPGPQAGKAPTVVFNCSSSNAAELKGVVEFYRAIMSTVRARVRDVRFVVACKESIVKDRVLDDLGVELAAPATDLRPIFHSRAVAVAPLPVSSDLRTNVLEPMAAGIPVVTTSTVREHLGARAGWDMHASEGPHDLARHIIELLENTTLREEMGAHGRRFVLANFSWEISTSRLDDLLEGIAPAPTPPGNEGKPPTVPAALSN